MYASREEKVSSMERSLPASIHSSHWRTSPAQEWRGVRVAKVKPELHPSPIMF